MTATDQIERELRNRKRRKGGTILIGQEPPFGPETDPPVLISIDGALFVVCCDQMAAPTFNHHKCRACGIKYVTTVRIEPVQGDAT